MSPSVTSSTAAIELPAAQQHRPGHRSTAHTDGHHLGSAGCLPIAALAPQLHTRLVQEAHAVQSAAGELPATGVDRQRTVQSDTRTVVDELADLAVLAKAHSFQP